MRRMWVTFYQSYGCWLTSSVFAAKSQFLAWASSTDTRPSAIASRSRPQDTTKWPWELGSPVVPVQQQNSWCLDSRLRFINAQGCGKMMAGELMFTCKNWMNPPHLGGGGNSSEPSSFFARKLNADLGSSVLILKLRGTKHKSAVCAVCITRRTTAN